MPGEKAIQIVTFLLLLTGLCSLIAWASYTYLQGTLILQIAGIALGWGVALIVLYFGFKALDWKWWS